MKKLLFTIGIVLFCFWCFAQNEELVGANCTSIMVGKKASADGSVITSHTCDSKYRTWVTIEPAADHKPGTMHKVYKGTMHTETAKSMENLVLAGEIPEAAHTYAYMNTAYPCMNEKQLGIGESTFGGRKSLVSENGIIDCTQLCQLMLERCATAREAITLAGELIKEYGEKENMEYQQKYCAEVLLGGFIDRIATNVNIEAIPTGFKALDDVLDGGLYEGLYCLGAISSLGKTTFALQIADQIAEHGHQVLIFSLEMSQNELIAKSISRNTLKRVIAARGDVRNAKTARGIMSGKKYPLYNQIERELIKNAVGDYQSISKNIYIREGMGNVGVDTIVEQVKEHIRKGNKPPVVIVDYLQILMPHSEKATDKANIDYTVLSLKRLSRDYKIPVIAISSFNRVSYGNEVSMQAFKESGSIEYSCDVLMGLQLQGVGSSDFDVNIAKRQEPRKIEAVILKNRNGKTGDMIGYEYYAMFNYFSETGLTEIPEKRPKYKRSEML